jgi:hypothetical protein
MILKTNAIKIHKKEKIHNKNSTKISITGMKTTNPT